MRALAIIETGDRIICDVVAAPSYGDCISLCRYFEKYWGATVEEDYDTGFAARFTVKMPGRSVVLNHDSQTGNTIFSRADRVDRVISDILADLEERLSD